MAEQRPILVKSIRALAKEFGLVEGSVRKWINGDNWPFPRVPPWDLDRVRAWREIYCKRDPAAALRKKMAAVEAGKAEFGDLGPLTKARIRATDARALLLIEKVKEVRREVHSVKECEGRRAAQIQALRDKLLLLPAALGSVLAQQPARTVERILSERLVAIINGFAGMGDGNG